MVAARKLASTETVTFQMTIHGLFDKNHSKETQ